MKPLWCAWICLALVVPAWGQVGAPGWQSVSSGGDFLGQSGSSGPIHPAVVRVIAPGGDGTMSLGSGTLVAVTEQHGLVVTNWHVVRDAAGPIMVAFPDGFRSGATLLKTNRDWDLAALAIWRPKVTPVPLAGEAPRLGEPLTIAGYGSGQYRMITGRCTQYVAPGKNQPFEMVELSAPARQGDSGGPIFNGRGELAGVLFGTAAGNTTGSYCGRVRWFLSSVVDDFQRLQPSSIMVAERPQTDARAAIAAQIGVGQPPNNTRPPVAASISPTPSAQEQPNRVPVNPVSENRRDAPPFTPQSGYANPAPVNPPSRSPAASIPYQSSPAPVNPAIAAQAPARPPGRNSQPADNGPSGAPAPTGSVAPTASVGASPQSSPQGSEEGGLGDLVRNVLAAVGGITILYHAMRVLAANDGGGPATHRGRVTRDDDDD